MGGPSPLSLAKKALKLGKQTKKQTKIIQVTRHDVAGPIPVSSTATTVATMSSIPAGNYVLTAQLTMLTGAGTGNSRCELTAGGEKAVVRTVQAGSSIETLTVVLAHKFAGTGSASLACANNAASWGTSSAPDENAVRIIAERAPSLTTSAVSG